jgi:hypothetical protein
MGAAQIKRLCGRPFVPAATSRFALTFLESLSLASGSMDYEQQIAKLKGHASVAAQCLNCRATTSFDVHDASMNLQLYIPFD